MGEFLVESAHVVGGLALLPPLIKRFNYCFVLCELRPAGAGPCTGKTGSLITVVPAALPREAVVFLEGMLAEALEIVCAVGGDVVEASALAIGGCAWRLLAFGGEVAMVLEFVVTETFGFGADHLAVLSPLVAPGEIQAILRLF